ncbi:UNVERIFIED_CONTAM: hypothetical protein Sindi_1261100 [Sesamum indicum]
MADQPLRAPSTNGASMLMETLVANSDESSSNFDESTQKLQKEIEQPKSIPLIKSFSEVVANSAGNRNAEMEELAAPYRFSLVGKFSYGVTPYSQMHQLIARLGTQGTFTVSMISLLLDWALKARLHESNYSRLWLRRIWFLQGFPMRILKWTPTFTPTQESSVVPIWVCFPELPADLFRKEALFSVASMIGSPLQIDALTLNKSKLSQARDSDCFLKGNAPKPPPRNKIKPSQQQFAGIEIKQARDRGKQITVSVGCPAADHKLEGKKASFPTEEAERSIADQPKKGDKDQQENDNQVEQIQSQGKQGNLKMDITGTPNSETYQGAAIHGCTSHTNLTPQGDNCIDNMDNFNLDDPLIAKLLDRDGNAENHDLSSISKPKTREKAKKTPKSGDKGCTSTKATGTRILLKGECSNQKQRNKFLSEMDIIEIQATQETSESEAQDTKESSDKEEAVTPTYNRFQSLDDSDSLLELDTELQPQVQASEQEIYRNANDIALESNLQEHILEDSTMSNKLKRNNSMEHNPLKQAKEEAKETRTKVTVLLGPSLKGVLGLIFIPFSLTFLTKSGVLLRLVLMFRNPRRALWEELKRLSLNKVPWIVGGDFNTMLHTHENQGGTISSLGSIEDFNDMVLDSGLTNAGFEGEPFTWTNKRWNKDNFGNIFSLVDQAKAAANEAEKQFDRLPSEANLINLNRQSAALVHALNLKSEFWRQKSNCKWLEAGERNTKFFHASVKKKRLKSRISRVMDNQQEISSCSLL